MEKITNLEVVIPPLETAPELGYKLLKPPSCLNAVGKLGSGSFGRVLKVTRDDIKDSKGNKVEYAAKLFLKSNPLNTKQRVGDEVRRIREAKSQHVLRCFALYENEYFFVAMFESARGGDLKKYLDKKKNNAARARFTGTQAPSKQAIFHAGALQETNAAIIIGQVLDALAWIHSKNLIHKDVKPANILFRYVLGDEVDLALNENMVLLCDFGLSEEIDAEKKKFSGSPHYMAPEIYLRKDQGAKADIWSLGIVTYELLYGMVPFREPEYPRDPEDQVQLDKARAIVMTKILETQVDFPTECYTSEDAQDFIRRCLDKDPDRRMSTDGALKHRWIVDHATHKSDARTNWNKVLNNLDSLKLNDEGKTSAQVSATDVKEIKGSGSNKKPKDKPRVASARHYRTSVERTTQGQATKSTKDEIKEAQISERKGHRKKRVEEKK